MKTKILSQLFLVVSLGLMYITFSSDSGGRYNGGTSCGSCHGSVNTNTTVALTGLPSTFVTGQTYTLTFTVTNTTNHYAGFNIACTAGTFMAGTGSRVNSGGTQITHTTPMAASGNTATFTFSWKAPATTAAVTFSAVGNAVNHDGGASSLDQWNTATLTVSGSFASSVKDLNAVQMELYPNPVQQQLTLKGLEQVQHVVVYNVSGQYIPVSFTTDGTNTQVDCSQLPVGQYFIVAQHAGQSATATFVKQ